MSQSIKLVFTNHLVIHINSLKTLLVLFVVLLLTACGGNEGSDSASFTDPNSSGTSTLNKFENITVTGENRGNNFVVSWEDVGAVSYRVLFTSNDGAIFTPTTTGLSLSISAANRALGGTLVVEGYDAFGNSVFSSQITVGALS